MGQDWRHGAEHFESQLIDHDVCSNYGNWQYSAGVGSDPREDRYFNIIKQVRNLTIALLCFALLDCIYNA